MVEVNRLIAVSLIAGLATVGLPAGNDPVADPLRPWTAQFVTPDGMVLVATVYPADPSPAPAVLYVHGFGRDRSDWDGHGRALAKAGVASMAFDLRGHGESTARRQRFREEPVRFTDLTELDEERMVADLAQAVSFLRARTEIDAARIVLVGDGLGANLSARHAGADRDLAGLALLSPRARARAIVFPGEEKGIFARPTLVVGADREPAADEIRRIGTLAAAGNPANACLMVEGLSVGGVRLLSAAEDSRATADRIYAWILDLLKKS